LIAQSLTKIGGIAEELKNQSHASKKSNMRNCIYLPLPEPQKNNFCKKTLSRELVK